MFKLKNIEEFKKETVQWGPIGEIVYLRTYARTKADGTKETWFDTCTRVIEGVFNIQKEHCLKNSLHWNEHMAQKSAKKMFTKMFRFKWLPPGRGIANMGTETVRRKGGAVLNNCGFISTEKMTKNPAEPFCFLMDMSMLGVGVGFDCEGAYTGENSIYSFRLLNNAVYVVEDTREAWVGLLERLLTSVFEGVPFPEKIDFSPIRTKGAPLEGMGGIASGPEPLIQMVIDILELISDDTLIAREGATLHILQLNIVSKALTSAHIVDIMNIIGKCVVSGGVRRTAELALGSYQDNVFIGLKEDEQKLNNYRWASNNSIIVRANDEIDYAKIAEYIKRKGEPGIFWIDNARSFGRMNGVYDPRDKRVKGANPCIEQCLEDGELCNIVENFISRHESLEEFIDTLKQSYLYAKTVSLVMTHNEEVNSIVTKNRRIGTSVTGVAEFIDLHGKEELVRWLKKGYAAIQYYDTIYSDWLKVNRSIKTTSVKPSGTVSLLPGVTPGMHYPHSLFYIRRVRLEDTSMLLPKLEAAGYPIEDAVREPNTKVVSFPISEKCTRTKKDVSMQEQFELAALLQEHWADNQVSVTIHFQEHEKDQIAPLLKQFSTKLKAVSMLQLKADDVYVQAPYEEISYTEWKDMKAIIVPVSLENSESGEQDKFCDGDACKIF